MKTFKGIVKNIMANKWMSFATIIVILIVFFITTIFIGLTYVSTKAVGYYEKKAQVIVYFLVGTPESEIIQLKANVESTGKASEIIYVSEADAVEKYKEMFSASYDNISSMNINPGILPASLEIKANSADELSELVSYVENLKSSNTYIEDVWYYRTIIDQIRTLASVIKYGGSTIVGLLIVFTSVLIVITIGFNIISHKDEIEIMHLVGGSDDFIKSPFIFEGAIYGFLGGLASSLFLILSWFVVVQLANGSDLYNWINSQLTDFSIQFLLQPDWKLVAIIILSQMTLGTSLGAISSYFAVIRFLNKRRV